MMHTDPGIKNFRLVLIVNVLCNSLPNDKIFHSLKLKAFADEDIRENTDLQPRLCFKLFRMSR